MTKIQNIDRVDTTNLRTIDQAELAQVEGGVFVEVFLVACFAAGVYVGYKLAK